ncbi:MAG: Sec-independent protein translocase protein TatB [SAR324 cluster bacterium]|jgi:sec-independent protein translocase protein TatB|nr:Sec-independent protein translocase protein TatB [SAR324 cluster bacterium]
MFGIGLPEMIVIAIVALVFIGPKNLPGVLRSVGRGLVQLKRATNEVRTTVQDEMDQIEREIDLKDVREAATDLKKDFDGVKSGLDPLSMNRISSGEQLEAVADVMDEQEKKKSESEKNSDTAKPAETVADSSSKTAKDASVSDLSGASKTKESASQV